MIIGAKKTSPFLYRGTGLIADKENPLVLEVLTASSTAYSYKPDSPIEEVSLKFNLYVLYHYYYHWCLLSIPTPLGRIRF